jgi:hypothetical protein
MEDIEKTSKPNEKYFCNSCNFICCKMGDWKRHTSRPKHIFNENKYKNDINDIKKTSKHICECGRVYRYNSGLWRHKKNGKCFDINEINEIDLITPTTQLTPELVMKIIEQNKELQQTLIDQNRVIMDLAQKTGSYNTTNNNCGNNNNTFNLQFFLNETCKNAINMTDFIDQIQISLSELEDTGRLGYAEGISKVFIKNLNDINYTDRPIHCSDLKRETLYIKDNNEWLKDDVNKSGLTKAIKLVANKNIKQISEWQKLHPHYSNPESKQNDKYMQIVLNSMSGSSKEESDKNYEKIAKNVIKEVVIEKN